MDDIKARYDKDYKDRKFGGEGRTPKWILELLSPVKGSRLLDIGCGQGFLLKEAQRLGLASYGIDISSEAIKLAGVNSPSSEVVCGDAHRLDWDDDYFDYITNIGSLEHFEKPELCLKEMKRVINKDGKACVMLPNLYYYRHIIDKLLSNKAPTSYQAIERFASLGRWTAFIEDNGFRIERVYKYNKFNRPKWFILLRSLVIPLRLSHHFVFICRRSA